MKDEEINLMVAQRLGFNISPDGKSGCWHRTGEFISIKLLPNYAGDLNAMHEAERVYVIPNRLGQIYTQLLDKIVGDEYGLYHASAKQRALCFLELP